ncbi:MAG TPA: glycosyltransferase family 39 protein, partial [Anaerolineae bacterium]|nr:glycosyltransferase family 39 protein [Anaerolineae bacterium]
MIRNGLVLTLLLVALALRLYKVSSVPLNIDEITTLSRYAPLPLLDIFTTYDSNNHPLASALAHLFSPQADHLFMLRWPFILLGMLALPFVYRLGTSLFGPKVGLLALLLVSASPVHAGYSMVARGYIGLITLTTVSLYCLWQAWRYNRWRDWACLVGVNVLVVYFHLFGGLLAVGTQLGLVGLGLLWQIGRKAPHS